MGLGSGLDSPSVQYPNPNPNPNRLRLAISAIATSMKMLPEEEEVVAAWSGVGVSFAPGGGYRTDSYIYTMILIVVHIRHIGCGG